MLTRRARLDGASPREVSESPKETTKKTRRTGTPRRSKTRSVEKKVRTRSRSANKKIQEPSIVLERFDRVKKGTPDKPKKELRQRKTTEPVESKQNSKLINSGQSPESDTITQRKSTFAEKTNDDKISSSYSRLINDDDEFDDEPQLLSNNLKGKLSPVTGIGGLIGNFLLAILLPVLVILSKIALKAKGNLIPFPRGYLRFGNYYDQDVFLWTGVIVVLQLLLSCVPLAKKSESLQTVGSRIYYYRFSGFINLIVGALIVAALQYYKFPLNFILDMMIKKTVPHIMASVLLTLIISFALCLKENFKNQNNKFDFLNYVQTFFIGTSINPTLGPLNLKLALYRYSFLMTILFDSLVILDSLKNPLNIHLYVVVGLQLFNAIDKLFFENHLLPSFYLQKEKYGYLSIVQQFLFPIINSLPVQILSAKILPVNYIVLGISSIVFLVGYAFQRHSDYIKYQFETNSKYAHRSSGGRRFNVNGLWSYIRYPNYLGIILIHLALVVPTIELNLESLLASWPVFLCPCYYIFTLAHRCLRVSNSYQLQYGYVWDHQFTAKWNLIPKIY